MVEEEEEEKKFSGSSTYKDTRIDMDRRDFDQDVTIIIIITPHDPLPIDLYQGWPPVTTHISHI